MALVTVTDAMGGTLTQEFDITVAADTVPPLLDLRPAGNIYVLDNGQFQAHLNTPVSFQVAASSSTSVPKLQVFANEIPLAIDSNGIATVTATGPGTLTVRAVATDEAGNATTKVVSLQVLDPNDAEAPIVELNPQIGFGTITSIADILGTVDDREDNLDFYTLEVAPMAGGEFVEIARGTSEQVNGVLGEFDPTVLQNDSYRLRLTAVDLGGNASSVEETVHVAGDLKLGNFQLSFTDLSIPVSGIPINVTRTYDSLNAGSRDDFGYGWRLEFRDTDLRTSLGAATPEEELLEVQPGFENGTRVYVTVPGGRRVGFTFKPERDVISQYLQRPGFTSDMSVYHPAFEADDGVFESLRVKNSEVSLNRRDGKFVQLGTGRAYNPADAVFGGTYLLTTKAGIEYEIDGTTGDLIAATDTNGNTLTFTDDGVFSQQTGVAVTFERDATGRIVAANDPDGKRVRYAYDGDGDLVSVTDREGNTTELKYEVEERPHYLNEIVDPLKRPVARTEYDEKGRLSKTIDVNGEDVEFVYDPDNSTQIIQDANGFTAYEYDERGNVIQQVNAESHATYLEYGDPNNPTAVTKTTDPNGNIATYTYDEDGNLLSRTELHAPEDENPPTTYYTYNQYGQNTSVTLPSGATFTQEYDGRGNLLAMRDGDGELIQSFTYDQRGNVTSETDTTGTTRYADFDAFGNPQWSQNPGGEITTSTYDSQGRLTTFTDSSGTSEITYDNEGREIRADYGDGVYVEYGYEGAGGEWTSLDAPTIGHIERRFTEDGKLGGWLTPDGSEITFTYNAAGQLETETNPGSTTRYTYDKLGRVKTTTDEATGLTTEYHYDKLPEGVADPDPDAPDNLLGRRSGQTVHLDDQTSYTTAVTYYADGQVKSSTDARGHTTFFDYTPTTTTIADALGRNTTSVLSDQYLPQEVRYADGTTETSEFLYANNLLEGKDYPTRIGDRSGRDRVFGYDELGRLTSATDWGDTTYNYLYGDNGLSGVESPTGEVILSYDYNDDGELQTVTYLNGSTREVTYDDTTNRPIREKLPSGETVEYEYTDSGLIQQRTVSDSNGILETTTSIWDQATGVLQSVTDATGTTTYHYDSDTQALTGVDYPNGGQLRYSYDILGRTEAVTVKADADAQEYTTRYTYDGAGN